MAVIAVYLAAFIAGVPIPQVSAHFRHDHGHLLLLLLDIVGVVPVGVLAWIVGRILFGAMGSSSPLLWILTALPWVLYAVAGEIDYIRTSGYSFQTALSVSLGWPSLPGLLMSLLSVPVGLWCASKAVHAHKLIEP